MDDLKGRVALVTGGSRGLGRAISLAFGAAGADVAVNYRTNQAAAEDVVAALTRTGRQAFAVAADVSVPQQVESMLASVVSCLGEVSILVNNAGVARLRAVDQVELEVFDEAIKVNLRSAFLVTRAVLPAMRRAGWGRLIFLSSTAANIGGVVGPHYAASKAGLVGMMHAYAARLARDGITANAIAPGLIETDMLTGELRADPGRVPIGRFGRPEEVADAAVMLAGNAYITGQTVHVNGGVYPTS